MALNIQLCWDRWEKDRRKVVPSDAIDATHPNNESLIRDLAIIHTINQGCRH